MSDPVRDAALLAALREGRITDPAERARLYALLSRSEDALEAFADAAEIMAELESEADAARPRPALEPQTALSVGADRAEQSGRPRAPFRFLLAAVLAACALGTAYIVRAMLRPTLEVHAIVAMLSGGDVQGPVGGLDWATTRGPDDPLTPDARGVRVGAGLAAVGLAVQRGDPAAAAHAGEVADLLDGVAGGSSVAAVLRAISAGQVQDRGRMLVLTKDAAEAAAGLLPKQAIAGGAWLFAAGIAAAEQDAGFFAARRSRAAIGAIGALGPHGAVAPELERLHAVVRRPDAADWSATRRDAVALLRRLGA
jgi:hypothetical protein